MPDAPMARNQGALELYETRDQELRVVERDERSLEARAPPRKRPAAASSFSVSRLAIKMHSAGASSSSTCDRCRGAGRVVRPPSRAPHQNVERSEEHLARAFAMLPPRAP